MNKIEFTRLYCQQTSESDNDDFYMQIEADTGFAQAFAPAMGIKKLNPTSKRFPSRNHLRMYVGQSYIFPANLAVQEFGFGCMVYAWDYDSGSGDDDLGYSSLEGDLPLLDRPPYERCSVKLSGDGDCLYKLYYINAETRTKVLRVTSIKCLVPSSGLDKDVVDSIFSVVTKTLEGVADVVANAVSDPRVKVASEGLKVAATALEGVPKIAEAIDKADASPDDLFITIADGLGRDSAANRIWPPVNSSSVYQEVVPKNCSHEFGNDEPIIVRLLRDVDINICDHDSSSANDIVGVLHVPANKADGVYVEACKPSDDSAALYLLEYEVYTGTPQERL